MITILFHMTVKPERQAEIEILAKDMMATTRAEDGCRAALGFLRLPPTEPELVMLHRWLDTWTGVGLITGEASAK